MAEKRADVAVVGAGVLGVSLAYWLSAYYDSSVVVIDSAGGVARHASGRNTGVIHRPFYLDPRRKKAFAEAANLSVPLWRSLADGLSLPWRATGTIELASREEELKTLEEYQRWGLENGMDEAEMEVLDPRGVASLEPEVKCSGALHVITDASVDYGLMTEGLFRSAETNGVSFLPLHVALQAREAQSGVHLTLAGPEGSSTLSCSVLINAGGGGSLELAHTSGLGTDLSSLSFRGEYWIVDEPFASRVTRNVYTIPRYPQFPFLDPHFVVRADGTREVGPNAVLVSGAYEYRGFGGRSVPSLLSRPMGPKLHVLSNATFLGMAAREWRSSVFKGALAGRVRRFIPSLRKEMLQRRGVSGIRTSVLDENGFVPEARVLLGRSSAHIVNFNSPGATGAPAFSLGVLRRMASQGMLDGLTRRSNAKPRNGWTEDRVEASLS